MNSEKQPAGFDMSRQHYLLPDAGEDLPLGMTKEAFGRRLNSLLLKKGWNQSELARKSGIGRDSVSNYVRGKNFPSQAQLIAMAEALGVEAEEILPNAIMEPAAAAQADLEIKSIVGTDQLLLRINRVVNHAQLVKILEILRDEK
jgi:transcriptional regulator with XRE-family HTH domain